MASYIEGNLSSGESIYYRAQVSWLSQIGRFALAIIFILIAMGAEEGVSIFFGIFAFFLLINAVLNVINTEMAITNKRVIAKFGLIRRNTIEMNLNRIESTAINQGILGRIFDFGSIGVRGTGGGQAPVPFIARPLEFRQQLNNLLEEEGLTK